MLANVTILNILLLVTYFQGFPQHTYPWKKKCILSRLYGTKLLLLCTADVILPDLNYEYHNILLERTVEHAYVC